MTLISRRYKGGSSDGQQRAKDGSERLHHVRRQKSRKLLRGEDATISKHICSVTRIVRLKFESVKFKSNESKLSLLPNPIIDSGMVCM
jgi:hypothetical protein